MSGSRELARRHAKYCTAAGNQSEAARRLGLSRATFYDRLKKYDLVPV